MSSLKMGDYFFCCFISVQIENRQGQFRLILEAIVKH